MSDIHDRLLMGSAGYAEFVAAELADAAELAEMFGPGDGSVADREEFLRSFADWLARPFELSNYADWPAERFRSQWERWHS